MNAIDKSLREKFQKNHTKLHTFISLNITINVYTILTVERYSVRRKNYFDFYIRMQKSNDELNIIFISEAPCRK